MTDIRVNAPPNRALHRARGARRNAPERMVYYWLIFLFALPSAVLACALHRLRGDGTPGKGPIARARAEAGFLTPMIFRG